jgi:hypothetical protein
LSNEKGKTQPERKVGSASPAVSQAVLQLHAAEYTALTTRYAYWHVLEFSILPIIPLYLGVAFEILRYDVLPKHVVVWICLIGFYIMGWLFAQSQLERYSIVLYLETRLRPSVLKLGPVPGLWGYERFFDKNRPTNADWIEMGPVLVGSLFFLITFVWRVHLMVNLIEWPRADWVKVVLVNWQEFALAVITLGALAFFLHRSVKAAFLRAEWSDARATKLDKPKPEEPHGIIST